MLALVTASMGRARGGARRRAFSFLHCPCGHQLPAVAFAGTLGVALGQTATGADTLLSIEWRCPVSPVQAHPGKSSGHERDVRQRLGHTVTFSVFVSGLFTDRFSLRTEPPGRASRGGLLQTPTHRALPGHGLHAGLGPTGTCQ